MSCEDYEALLDERLDGSLSSTEDARLSRHLGECVACRRRLRELQRLRERVAALPAVVEPPVDLWPQLAGRLQPKPEISGRFGVPRWRPRAGWALAASLLVVPALLWWLAPAWMTAVSPEDPNRAASPATVTLPAAEGAGALPAGLSPEDDLQQALEELRAAVARHEARLSPRTRAALAHNLEVIDEALAEIRLALDEEPEDPRLQRLLLASYRRQAELLRRALLLES